MAQSWLVALEAVASLHKPGLSLPKVGLPFGKKSRAAADVDGPPDEESADLGISAPQPGARNNNPPSAQPQSRVATIASQTPPHRRLGRQPPTRKRAGD